MAQKKDLFTRAIEIYRAKYQMDTPHLLKFLRDKIDSPPQSLDLIEQQIQNYQQGTESLTEQKLRKYLHIVAAVQADVDVQNHQIEDLKGYNKIKFKSKKQKDETKSGKMVGKVEPKKEIVVDEQRDIKPIGNQLAAKRSKKSVDSDQGNRQVLSPKSPISPVPSSNNPIQQPSSLSSLQVKSPSKLSVEQKVLGIIEQNIVEEDKNSTVIGTSSSEEFFAKFPEAQLMKMRVTSQKQVQIRGYDKFGQNYFNPIIKYRVIFKERPVYRRYTQFQNLLKYLSKRYEGFILPDLPPKEGIKSNLSYFRGVDEAFLNERQSKLEEMLNILVNTRFICDDEALLRFLTDQDYEVQAGETEGTLNYLRSLGEIAFNAKELKTYGMAYYNYFKSFKKSDINTKVTECYKAAEPVLSYCLELQSYRTAVISNFDKRREVFSQLEADQGDRTLTITEFDKLSFASAAQVRNLDKQMNKYYELKSQESWLSYLMTEKQSEMEMGGEVGSKLKEIRSRIEKMQLNLMDSVDSLVRSKSMFLQEIGCLMLQWRRSIHP